ncbi:MAG: right-handed parallel beta-helix repeat-containing protein [Lentisphaerota bacterium]
MKMKHVLAVLLAVLPMVVQGANYTVTNAGDSVSGGTLRWAVNSANTNPGADTVLFSLASPYVIAPTGAITLLSGSTTVDGTLQPGYTGTPLVRLSGVSSAENGLRITYSTNHTIKGLRISGFPNTGIQINNSRQIAVESCHILSNAINGVYLSDVVNSRIGGTNAATRNVVSGNGQMGVYITGVASTNNRIAGNYIGTDLSGTVAWSNLNFGVIISVGQRNIIGGTNAWERNLISGNQTGVILDNASRNTILGNYIGTDASGSNALGNLNGVCVTGSSNLIGGAVEGARNILSGNYYYGLQLASGLGDVTGNRVEGNYIGLGADGLHICPNREQGILIQEVAHNIIGGTNAGVGNVISGNLGSQILMGNQFETPLPNGNTVQGNYIGTDASGLVGISTGNYGVLIYTAHHLIGGSNAAARNVISGQIAAGVKLTLSNAFQNVVVGNYIGTDKTGSNAIPNNTGIDVDRGANNRIGGYSSGERNVISGNRSSGISLAGENSSTGNTVYGNFIGVDAEGVLSLGNGNGIAISSPRNVIGGVSAGARNIISGNRLAGMSLMQTGATANRIEGNYIGAGISGLSRQPEGQNGIVIWEAPGNQIGGANTASRNVLSCFSNAAIRIYGSNACNNVIQGNYIGVDVTGSNVWTSAGGDGLRLEITCSNRVGGGAAGAGNVISGHGQHGLYMTLSQGVAIQGNVIGADAAGVAALGNLQKGIMMDSCRDNLIGGRTNGEGNLICGNLSDGIYVQDPDSTGNDIQGNWIGLSRATTALGNGGHGIYLALDACTNWVGGQYANSGNQIAYNAGCGVYILGTNATGNAVTRNQIYRNKSLGVDLYPQGVMINDKQDPDQGCNRMQNYPELLEATNDGANLTIIGKLNSMPLRTYHVEFFGNTNCDITGYGQGAVFIGEINSLQCNASAGDAGFTNAFVVPNPPPNFITATATDQGSLDSSEFSHYLLLDSDHDGMGDGYETAYFGSPQGADPAGDLDFDGYNNLEEFMAGTNPDDDASFLRISGGCSSATGAVVRFVSSDERKYNLQGGTSLVQNAQWIALQYGLLGDGSELTMNEPPTNAPLRFHRVAVELP